MPNVDDEQWSPPLIQTKLTPPRQPRSLVSRRALVDCLGTDLERKPTLVVAPAVCCHSLRCTAIKYREVGASYIDDLLVASQCESAPANAASETLAAERLSAREIEILDYIARGLTNKEIARALRVAPETVKWHLKHIYEKLNVSSRLQAVQKRGAPGQNPRGV